MARVARQRFTLRTAPGLNFAKLLGTGTGETFTPRDADPHHWALLTVFADDTSANAFEAQGRELHSWRAIATEELMVRMRPLSSVGRWSGTEPFPAPIPQRWDGPVAALTRARIRHARMRRFWAAVPPVVVDLHNRPGLLCSLGIGEAPIGLQGTFSMWQANRDLTDFAYRSDSHREVISETERQHWYAEELFARFAVIESRGTLNGRDPLVQL